MASSFNHIIKSKSSFKVNGSLWIECDGERFFGPGKMELLQHIDKTGSINKAAKKMGMSYNKAWQMIASLNLQAKRPIVIVQSGGQKGGGSVLTAEARDLMEYHRKFRKRFDAFLQKETRALLR